LGLVQDLEHSSRLFTVEAGRRIYENVRVNLEIALFMDGALGSVDNALGDDEFIKLELLSYF
jgi:hypothetical protein